MIVGIGVDGWRDCCAPKRPGETRKKEEKKKAQKQRKEREGQKGKGRKAGKSVNNDTSRGDLDEHAVLRLTWPAEMMCIPAKLSFRQS